MLVTAHRADAHAHDAVREWFEELLGGSGSFGVADLVLRGFVRVVTHPAIFDPPSPTATALEFCAGVRARPGAVPVQPGARHWRIFDDLCRRTEATGNRIPDAYLAALAIESGSEWVTMDRGFARYPGLRWRHPLDG